MANKTKQIHIFGIISKIWIYIEPSHKKALIYLLILMLTSSVLEVLSIGAIFPFLSILASPEQFSNGYSITKIFDLIGIDIQQDLTLLFAILFMTSSLLAGLMRILVLWYGTKVSYLISADLSAKIYEVILSQPYSFHIQRNSSEVIDLIVNKSICVMITVNGILTVLSSTIIFIFIFFGMLYVNPKIFLIAITGFGSLYLLVMLFSRKQLGKNAETITNNSTKAIKYLQEGLGGIRDILLDGTQKIYLQQFNKADFYLRAAQGSNIFISQYPRYAIESIGMVLMASLALILTSEQSGIYSAIPIIGLLAVSAQRILPILQQLFSAWAAFKGNETLLREFLIYLDYKSKNPESINEKSVFKFSQSIEFKDVAFKYQANAVEILSDINISIKKGSKVGIIGKTGSGKSTFLDILMGLLQPTFGNIFIDGQMITSVNRGSWQKNIAHVPQSVYLSDSTIKENIAFGVPCKEIDISRMHAVTAQAQLVEFIDRLPQKYDTCVGERGMQLSGGQRQRIGIARALYKRADLIIFDEATSALDEETENNVMNEIINLDVNLTIVIVSHRVSTLKKCDVIYEIKDGVLFETSKQ